jgi:gluconokinase
VSHLIVLVMGVSGSGKSFVASRLAEATHWPFAEGDDYHSEANKAKMHAAIPLTDADRGPWLESLHQVLLHWQQQGQSGILSCSALKAEYRAHLAGGLDNPRFVWIDPPRSVLIERMANRPGHFMSPALLDSQIATLEPPVEVAWMLRLDGTHPIEEEIQTILNWLEN